MDFMLAARNVLRACHGHADASRAPTQERQRSCACACGPCCSLRCPSCSRRPAQLHQQGRVSLLVHILSTWYACVQAQHSHYRTS